MLMKKIVLIIVFGFMSLTVHNSWAGIEVMNDEQLSDVDGQFSTVTVESWHNDNDTIRIFMDVHMEIYGTIESVRTGYYHRDADQMQTNMASIGLSGFEGFYDVQAYNSGANYNFAKITSDYNTMAPQGAATIEPWGNGGVDSSNATTLNNTLTPNTNYNDWDIWMDNIRIGESPDKPVYINGQIIRVEFDQSIYNANPKIQRIIIGTNDQQGNMRLNMQRYTGIVNPMLLAHTSARSLGVIDPYKYTTGTMQMVRDSYVQCFGINIFNVEDRDTGFWIIMNFKGDHIAFEGIFGLPENAIEFDYKKGVWDIPLWDPDWKPTDSIKNPGSYVEDGYKDWRDTGLHDPYDTKPQWDSTQTNNE